MDRRPRRWYSLVTALLSLALLGTLAISAWGSVFSSDRVGAIQLAGLFGVPILVGVFALPMSNAAQRRAQLARQANRPLPRILELLTEPLPDELSDAPVGRARAQIDVVQTAGSLTISVPTRHSMGRVLSGVAFMMPAVFLLLRLLYVLLAAGFGGMSPDSLLLVGSVGVMANVLVNLPFWLAGIWGAYLIFGQEVVVVRRQDIQVSKTVWGMRLPGARLALDRSPAASAQRDQQLFWAVTVAADVDGVARDQSTSFGRGSLTRAQADELAAAIEVYFSAARTWRPVSNPGVNPTTPREVSSGPERA